MLSEKAGQKFGGMCKTVKSTKKVGSKEDKCSTYDKEYHYPSGEGSKIDCECGSGSEQHTEAEAYHKKVSK